MRINLNNISIEDTPVTLVHATDNCLSMYTSTDMIDIKFECIPELIVALRTMMEKVPA